MAGIYIHVPFCRKACHYCDFHFSTQRNHVEEMIRCMLRELALRKNFLKDHSIGTIYFGGGTPSLLPVKDIGSFLENIHQHFRIDPSPEITLEANPDDLTENYLRELKKCGINRLSIGIQSFHNHFLQYLNRIHSAEQAIQAYQLARQQGFSNINIDVIYAIPGQTRHELEYDIDMAIRLQPEHISAYILTIEDGTVLGNWYKRGKLVPFPEDEAATFFELMSGKLTAAGYEHYEISNFARPSFRSIHNSNYWKQVPYLGIGPGAHSFNGIVRQVNIPNNPEYCRQIQKDIVPLTTEFLSHENRINEYILTSLRTSWGLDLKYLKNNFDYTLPEHQHRMLAEWESMGLAEVKQDVVRLTLRGRLLADRLSSELFVVEKN
jgi:oxygen-independent coproporphyrinogen-3 oxidase